MKWRNLMVHRPPNNQWFILREVNYDGEFEYSVARYVPCWCKRAHYPDDAPDKCREYKLDGYQGLKLDNELEWLDVTELDCDFIRELALQKGFKLKPQPDGTMDLNPYVYDFAQALLNSIFE